jgi:signal transduction histidine kinase
MARPSHRPPSGHTILVVDDEEETRVSLRGLLEREGHCVLSAGSGEEALALLKEHDVHLILSDYVMPRMSGARLIRQIRTFDPYVQIILQTGYAGEKPPQVMLNELDIQGYHEKTDGPEKLLMWVAVGLKAYRLIQRLRDRERVQADLVANVSHELRTPLNIIGGYAQLLLDAQFEPLPTRAEQPVHAILTATRNLTNLVADFLHYAKVEAGMTSVSGERVAIRELAHEVQRMGELLLERKPVRLSVGVEGERHDLVTDSVKVRTILRNLVTNAIKFTASGAITVHFHGDERGLRVVVADTGPGIRPEDRDMIFEPFRQADSSDTRKHGGIGLGLAISRKFARLLGGDIAVDSAVGEGSTFTVTLPDGVPSAAAAA